MRSVIGRAIVLTVIAMVSIGSLSSLGLCDETILSKHVTLTSFDSPDSRAYEFNLISGDTILISISVSGDSINLYIYNSTGDQLLQRTNIFDLEEQWTVPYDDTFEFIIETWASEDAQAIVDITLYCIHAPDNVPPKIEIISPENKTYTTNSVPLTFTVNEPASWISYSLDNEANMTITGNTTITSLSGGVHNIKVYAEDLSGNVGSSGTVHFAVSIPLLFHDVAVESVASSLIEVYEGDSVDITVVTQNNGNYTETFSLTIYVNNFPIQTQTVSNLAPAAQSTLVFNWDTTGFSLGKYTIKAEANIVPGETNVADNVKVNGTVHILREVDNQPPAIEILSPENETYTVNSVVLTFVVNEPASWMAYSLDGGVNITIAGNTTLKDLSNGSYAITVHASDISGNVGSSNAVRFVVSVPLPLLFHDVTVASVVSSSTEVYKGDPVNVTVVVQNNGNYTETFNVATYANDTTIQTQTVSDLAPATQNILIFVWNTTGFSPGSFALKAEADIVPGETHTVDNIKIDGTVHVTSKSSSSVSPLFIIAIPLAVAAAISVFIIYKRKPSV